ncbi:hypothetical protein TIFTF001_056488 [Ficus carica]|uniref:Uncharacterized protein n=1 Tax=Ficus carica TaxID=3494 RepID=A0AA88JJT9_FICCA|nr:hypothetical protein TIFTF001_056488 [Ficus carica]
MVARPVNNLLATADARWKGEAWRTVKCGDQAATRFELLSGVVLTLFAFAVSDVALDFVRTLSRSIFCYHIKVRVRNVGDITNTLI